MTQRSSAIALRDAVRVSAVEQRERAHDLLAHIQRNATAIKEAFFEIGQALAELNNNRLYLALGHQTFAEMLTARGLFSQAQANKLIAVATLMPRETALLLGQERSYLLTRYAQLTEHGGSISALLRKDPRVGGKRLVDMPVRELAETTRALRERTQPRRTDDGALEVRRQAREAQVALRRKGAVGARVVAVRTGGRWVLRIDVEPRHARALFGRG